MERTDFIVDTVESALDNVGHAGQVGIVWFSMGVAIWQIILIAQHLLFSAGKFVWNCLDFVN